MFFFLSNRPNQTRPLKPLNPHKPAGDDVTGNAGHDGYTRLSAADRETGLRNPVGVETPSIRPIYED